MAGGADGGSYWASCGTRPGRAGSAAGRAAPAGRWARSGCGGAVRWLVGQEGRRGRGRPRPAGAGLRGPGRGGSPFSPGRLPGELTGSGWEGPTRPRRCPGAGLTPVVQGGSPVRTHAGCDSAASGAVSPVGEVPTGRTQGNVGP